jgi:hypothetical protein
MAAFLAEAPLVEALHVAIPGHVSGPQPNTLGILADVTIQ